MPSGLPLTRVLVGAFSLTDLGEQRAVTAEHADLLARGEKMITAAHSDPLHD